MAGYTDSIFRQICKDYGADVTMTELVSADAIYFALKKSKQKLYESKTYQLLKFTESERPLVVQLFGKDPEKFLVAAKFIEEDLKPDGIDINIGCSVRKVLKSGHGAALLKNEELACEIIRTLKTHIKLPISVKTRLGYEDPNQILEFGPKLVEAGTDALIVHGRCAKQAFSGTADWDNIYKLKEKLPETIVIGNGDIKSYSEIENQLKNLDGVAIGRAVLGQPWIFSQNERPLIKEIITLVKKQSQIAFELKGKQGIVELRKHLTWYFKGQQNAVELRKQLVSVESIEDINRILDSMEAV